VVRKALGQGFYWNKGLWGVELSVARRTQQCLSLKGFNVLKDHGYKARRIGSGL